MLEEALPIAIGVGAALLPAMAFGGLAAARAFIYLGAGEQLKRGQKRSGEKPYQGGGGRGRGRGEGVVGRKLHKLDILHQVLARLQSTDKAQAQQ